MKLTKEPENEYKLQNSVSHLEKHLNEPMNGFNHQMRQNTNKPRESYLLSNPINYTAHMGFNKQSHMDGYNKIQPGQYQNRGFVNSGDLLVQQFLLENIQKQKGMI